MTEELNQHVKDAQEAYVERNKLLVIVIDIALRSVLGPLLIFLAGAIIKSEPMLRLGTFGSVALAWVALSAFLFLMVGGLKVGLAARKQYLEEHGTKSPQTGN